LFLQIFDERQQSVDNGRILKECFFSLKKPTYDLVAYVYFCLLGKVADDLYEWLYDKNFASILSISYQRCHEILKAGEEILPFRITEVA
jgi:hypothetical protein